MLTILYQAIVQPLVYVTELVYMLLDWIFKGNTGIAITGVSVIVSLLSLPLYIKAEETQKAERVIQEKMRKRVTSIRKNFSGDEKYMILSTYYRQNGYHPLFALRSSVGLLVQVPFFIAAYNFLSGLDALNGQSFMGIPDLGQPDRLVSAGGFELNVLPVLMTAINVVSGFIYTRGLPVKEKIQLNAVAIAFLVLLYNSPSALVLYWTLNNLFSLIKNVFLRLKNPRKALYITLCIFLSVFCFYVFFVRHHSRSYRLRNYGLTAILAAVLAAIPLYIRGIHCIGKKWFTGLIADGRHQFILAVLNLLVLFLLIGVYVPFSVVSSSPFEFSFLGSAESPFDLLIYPVTQAFGFFLLWPLFLYLLFSKRFRAILVVAGGISLIIALVNVFLFPVGTGEISRTLQFTDGAHFSQSLSVSLIHWCTIAGLITAFLVLISRRQYRFVVPFLGILVAGIIVFSGIRAFTIHNGYTKLAAIREQETELTDTDLNPVLSLSKNGTNVVVIMLDKAVGAYLPLVLEEKPDLIQSLDGFVFYPNALSFGEKTIMGAPPLFGGYEYTPAGMNERPEIPMVEKHNEALLVLPELFRRAGYETLITDAPFVNYEWVADPSFFRSRGFTAENLKGKYTSRYLEEYLPELDISEPDQIVRRNMIFFSLLTASPSLFRGAVYNDGRYWNSSLLSVEIKSLDSYAVLHYLDRITGTNARGNTFTVMVNDLPHDPALLSGPEYKFAVGLENPETGVLGKSGNYDRYHSNAASIVMLVKWFEYLKKNDVYDNTRIILTSDHGSKTDHPNLDSFGRNVFLRYNPLLLVKDFSRRGSMETDTRFMTNADVPTLALESIIEHPLNPFTGNAIDSSSKDNGIIIPVDVTIHQGFTPDLKTRTTCFDAGARIYRVHADETGALVWESDSAD